MIEIIDNILPVEINKKIIFQLFNHDNWRLPHDTDGINKDEFINEMLYKNKKNAGMSLTSYEKNDGINLNSPLNLYAETIFYIIKERSKYKFKDILRFYWNYYDTSSSGNYHVDKRKNNIISIVYNLHSNDGGTEFKDLNKFYKSNEGQAIIFPSNIMHKGVAPKKFNHRFNLNIVATI